MEKFILHTPLIVHFVLSCHGQFQNYQLPFALSCHMHLNSYLVTSMVLCLCLASIEPPFIIDVILFI
jgi:hypothetical protein